MASTMENQPPTEEMKNLVMDQVTGEQISKTELKRRNKQRETAAKKADKAANAPLPAAVKRKQNVNEDGTQPTGDQFRENKTRTVKKMKESHPLGPYPARLQVNMRVKEFVQHYASLTTGQEKKDVEVRLRGRVRSCRYSSSKLCFYDIEAQQAKLQVMCQANNATGDTSFDQQHENIGLGDIIHIIGFPGRTNPKDRAEGEVSIFAREVYLVAPCLEMLPSERFGFKDIEQRFRQREVDFIMNSRSYDTMVTRARMISYIRHYFEDNDFVEFETPILNQIAGGAMAKPFTTHYNAYNQEVFMRIAPELYLKRLVVGGFDRVFEIGKLFRNEDADLTHNPEFTTCEFYEADADVYDVMERTEDMISGLVQHLRAKEELTFKTKDGKDHSCSSSETVFHTQDGECHLINWAKPWKRVEMIPALESATGEKFPAGDQLETPETNAFLRRLLKKMDVQCLEPLTSARMIDKLVGECIESKCINPTFITEHPQIMSPLAKAHPTKPGLTARFEAFVCTKEIVNAYSELNDPFEQRKRFEEQARQKAQGDDEAQLVDENFMKGISYGLTSTGGWGLGIDRLAMFMSDHFNIREVIAFPYMKEPQRIEREKAGEGVGIEDNRGRRSTKRRGLETRMEQLRESLAQAEKERRELGESDDEKSTRS